MRGTRQTALGFTLIELMVVVAILAVLAVVAVPAFIKYMRRAKTTEAIDQLDKLNKASGHYYATAHVGFASGNKVLCQFPRKQAMTPNITSKACCGAGLDTDADDRCDVDPTQWDAAVWSALSFQMSDQHYFGYAYDSNGETMDKARFTASAHADLDCDSTLSTFQRYGYGDEAAGRSECSMQSSAAFFKNQPTE
ncbi:MAG: prepilin-type N-terminal cleavage/methylation domain-containing protein [Myxococcota bacterium]|jgi:prepilin-type N-terminal cleavage/methylation domain-containing protein